MNTSPRWFLRALRFLVAMFLIATIVRPAWAADAKVTYVTDGDTLWVRPAGGGKSIKVRIDGIDAPEICQAGGDAARMALASRVVGRTVVVSTRRQDDYGRQVATIELDGEDIAAWMVSQGHAWSYQVRRDGSRYRALQIQARAERRGLFAQPGALHPRVFRRQHGSCRT